MVNHFVSYHEKQLQDIALGLEENKALRKRVDEKIREIAFTLKRCNDPHLYQRYQEKSSSYDSYLQQLKQDKQRLKTQLKDADIFHEMLLSAPETLTHTLAGVISEELQKFKAQRYIDDDKLFFDLHHFEHKLNLILKAKDENYTDIENWRYRYYLLNGWIWSMRRFSADFTFEDTFEKLVTKIHIPSHEILGPSFTSCTTLFEAFSQQHPRSFNRNPDYLFAARVEACDKLCDKILNGTKATNTPLATFARKLAFEIRTESKAICAKNPEAIAIYTDIVLETLKILKGSKNTQKMLELANRTIGHTSISQKITGSVLTISGALLMAAGVASIWCPWGVAIIGCGYTIASVGAMMTSTACFASSLSFFKKASAPSVFHAVEALAKHCSDHTQRPVSLQSGKG